MDNNNIPSYIHNFKNMSYPAFRTVMDENTFDDLTIDIHNRGVAVRNKFRAYGMEPVVEVKSFFNAKFKGIMVDINYEGFLVATGFSIEPNGEIIHTILLRDGEYEEFWDYPEWGSNIEGSKTFIHTMMFMVDDFINNRILPGNQ